VAISFLLKEKKQKFKAKATLPPAGHTPSPATLCRAKAFFDASSFLCFLLPGKCRTYAFYLIPVCNFVPLLAIRSLKPLWKRRRIFYQITYKQKT